MTTPLALMNDSAFYSNAHYPRALDGHHWYRHLLIRPRFRAIRRMAAIEPGMRVLEVGCDRGILVRMLERTGALVYGVDVNEDAVRAAQHPRISLASGESVPFPDQMFQLCVSCHVIEHVESPRDFLLESARLLAPGGKVVLIYPWEVIRGMTTVPDIIFSGRVPTLSLMRRIHRHAFTPATLRRLIRGMPLRHVHSRMFLGLPHLAPQLVTAFQKT
ncbi:MAG: class I SAM-dependent methyltransferase [Longimicrobiales bacterium]